MVIWRNFPQGFYTFELHNALCCCFRVKGNVCRLIYPFFCTDTWHALVQNYTLKKTQFLHLVLKQVKGFEKWVLLAIASSPQPFPFSNLFLSISASQCLCEREGWFCEGTWQLPHFADHLARSSYAPVRSSCRRQELGTELSSLSLSRRLFIKS